MAKLNVENKGAISAIKAVINVMRELKKELRWVKSVKAGSFTKLEQGLKKVRIGAQDTAQKMNHLNAILKKQSITINKLRSDVDKLTASERRAAKATDNLGKKTKRTKGAFDRLTGSVGKLVGAFGVVMGIQLFGRIILNAFKTIKTFDSLAFALERVTKSTVNAAVSSRFILEITEAYGAEIVTTTERWIKFLAAAQQSKITLRDTEKIFRTMTKAAGVLGLRVDELRSIYLALEQMLSKGKITTEELRRQLGERLPGAMGIMAASMGVTITQLDKMMKRGEVLSAEVLPGFADAVELAFGLESVEKIETLIASQVRLTNAWKVFVKNVFEDSAMLRGIFDGLAQALSMVGEWFFTDQQKRQIAIIKEKKEFEKSMEDSAK